MGGSPANRPPVCGDLIGSSVLLAHPLLTVCTPRVTLEASSHMEDPMPYDNTEIRRDYLAREYRALNDRIAELQSTTRAYAEQKANVVRAMRDRA